MKLMLLVLFLFLMPASPSIAASFDCSKARMVVEQAICKDQSLSYLDEELAGIYQQFGGSIIRSQREWLEDRNKCFIDLECLKEKYLSRIEELEGMLRDRFTAPLIACYENASTVDSRESCMGITSNACMESSPSTNVAGTSCLHMESEVWSHLMDTELLAAENAARVQDSYDLDYRKNTQNPSRVELLHQTQAAWESFMGTECSLVFHTWLPGSLSGWEETTCAMEMLAQRTIRLRRYREEMFCHQALPSEECPDRIR